MIDEEVRRLISEAYESTKNLLTLKKREVEILAKQLLEKEVLFQSDVEKLIGKRPFEDKKILDVDTNAELSAPPEKTVVETINKID
jgi:cell division protease FtsH